MTHIFYCAWLKTQVETCVTGTLDMSQAPLRHKWKPGLKNLNYCMAVVSIAHAPLHVSCQ